MKSVLILLLLTLLAAGGGVLNGLQLVGNLKLGGETAPASDAKAGDAKQAEVSVALDMKDLPPIVTNLAGSDSSWIRIESSILIDKKTLKNPDRLVGDLAGDILAFLRSLSLAQLQGASGLQHLRQDLNERVSLRSDGAVRDLVIRTLVIQ